MSSSAQNPRQEGGSAGAPPDPTQTTEKKRGLWWKILAVLGLVGAGCASASFIMSLLVVGTLSVGVASCTSSCSDNPIGDSKADAVFIASLDATSRDVETFDALRSAIDALYENQEVILADNASLPQTTDELRTTLTQGSWPKGIRDEMGESRNPQTWIRLAELAETYLEEETGEDWQVVDFAYPFPNNGPIPVPPTRDESDSADTRLLCVEGEDEGLYAVVRYYRWREVAEYENNLAEAREDRAKLVETSEQLAATGLLGARDYVISQGDLYVWATGDDDELRDPETFLVFANQLTEGRENYFRVTLLEQDAPCHIGYEPLSYNYPNKQPLVEMSRDEARELLLDDDYIRYLDMASEDELLCGYRRDAEVEVTLEELEGVLAPVQPEDYRNPWRSPDEGSVFDESLAEAAAERVGGIDASSVIATSVCEAGKYEQKAYVWIVLPRGSVPETPQAFCDLANGLRDTAWEHMGFGGDAASCYVHVFVIEPEVISGPTGETWSFDDLRAAAADDPQVLGDCTVDVSLSALPSTTVWSDGEDRLDYDCYKSDVGGRISRTRAWRYESEG